MEQLGNETDHSPPISADVFKGRYFSFSEWWFLLLTFMYNSQWCDTHIHVILSHKNTTRWKNCTHLFFWLYVDSTGHTVSHLLYTIFILSYKVYYFLPLLCCACGQLAQWAPSTWQMS
jgi:hypothetical protein